MKPICQGLVCLALFLSAGTRLQAQESNALRVLTFNLRYASAADGANSWSNATQSPDRRRVAVLVISNRAPDIIGFQEGEDGQIDYLATQLPAYSFEKRKPSGGGGNENAAFAWKTNRLDLLDRGLISLGPSPGGGYWNNPPGTNFDPYIFFPNMGLNFPRLALWGRFKWKPTGQEFYFYTTHFDFNEEPQVRSAFLIADDASSRCRRLPASPLAISVGDYNSNQTNRDWKFFTGSFFTNGATGDFTDSWLQVHGGWANAGTLHGFSGGVLPENLRIDWILHRGGLSATQAVVVYDSYLATNLTNGAVRTQYPSDHYPVFATLRFPDVPADFDRDGLPDNRELSSTNSRPADADTDNDLLLDGQEDINGNGSVDGGETDPAQTSAPQNPTDIRNFQMDGIRDHPAALLASHGLDLFYRFDGRYLYVATQDAGEASDHFVFITTDPDRATNAPWAKSGQVAQWIAFLADENDNDFCGWHDANRNLITNLFAGRAKTYFQNGGRIEGVLDLGQLLSPGFTNALYLCAAPFGNSAGGTNYAPAQAPAGNGDGNLLGATDFVKLDPGDLDGDNINDAADADRDGDLLPDAWELAHGLDPASATDDNGAQGDPDGDGSENRHEFLAGTFPDDNTSVFQLGVTQQSGNSLTVFWPALHGRTNSVARSGDLGGWSAVYTGGLNTVFPLTTNLVTLAIGTGRAFFRAEATP